MSSLYVVGTVRERQCDITVVNSIYLSWISETFIKLRPSGHIPANITNSTDRKIVIAATLGTSSTIILFIVTVGGVGCLWRKCTGLRESQPILPTGTMDQPGRS